MPKWMQKWLKVLNDLIKTTPPTPTPEPPNPPAPPAPPIPPAPPTPPTPPVPPTPPAPPVPPVQRAVKMYESPKGLKIAGMCQTLRGMIVCEYDTKSRKHSIVRLISDWRHPLHDGREETIQAPVVFGNLLVFPTERHKDGLIVMDRSSLRKVKGIVPKYEICIAGGLWKGHVVVASNRFPVGHAVIQDAISGETLRIMPMLGVVAGIAGEWCIVRSDGDGDNCVTNWVTGERHDIAGTAIAEWRGGIYVGNRKGQIFARFGSGGFVKVADLGAPIYSLRARAADIWMTTSKPNSLWAMGINNNPVCEDVGEQASLGWFGLPIEVDANNLVCWAEWDPKRELSIVWRLG